MHLKSQRKLAETLNSKPYTLNPKPLIPFLGKSKVPGRRPSRGLPQDCRVCARSSSSASRVLVLNRRRYVTWVAVKKLKRSYHNMGI